MKILVIEDNPDIKEILSYILNDDGHEVISCTDGSLLNSLDTIKPDLILMDEILSDTRGSELCRRIKRDASTKHIPVILVSAISQLQRTAIQCGADAFIEKPFNIDSVTGIVKSFA